MLSRHASWERKVVDCVAFGHFFDAVHPTERVVERGRPWA
jgi:hypothetical protein